MPQDNIFKVDPIRTDLTAPVTNVTVQQPLDNSRNDQRRSAGLSSLADSFTRLSVKKQANQIHNDTITAELAAAYEQEMPGGLEPEAQLAYSTAVDRTYKGKIIQQMQDFLLIEGSDILSDNRVDRKARATSFKNQLLALLNEGKSKISKVNAAEMFADMDTMFGQIMGKANVFLAKDKKQEAMATASSSFRQLFKEHLGFMEELTPKVSDTDELGNELSASQYAQKLSKFHSGWTAKHINSKWFNKAVAEISRTNVGADIQDIKATALTIVGDELIKKIAKNPELVNEGLMRDIITNVKGSTKGVTLQDEIDSQSNFGKVLEGVYKDYNTGLKSTLTSLDKTRTDNDKARDNRISNYIQDNINDLSKEQALSHARSINNPSEQRAVENHVNKHFSGENKKDVGHADFGDLVKSGAENFYDAATDKFDTVKFYEYAGKQGFKTSAIKTAAEEANPQTRRGERRKKFFDQQSIKNLSASFDNVITQVLKNNNLEAKFQTLRDKGIDLGDPIMKAKYAKLLGKPEIDQIERVLDAKITLGAMLESLIRNNPDVPVDKLVAEAQKQAQGLIVDATKEQPFGTAVAESGKEKVKTIGEKLVEGQDKYNPELEDNKPVAIMNSNKALFSTDQATRDAGIKKIVDDLQAYDKAKAELVKIQKEYKGASTAKKATIIASLGANPENLRVPTAIPEIAAIVNPDPAVRRYLAIQKLSGQTEIQQPMKLDQPSAWNKFIDFVTMLPEIAQKGLQAGAKEVSESIQPAAKGLAESIQPAAKSLSQGLQQLVGRRQGDKPTELIDSQKEKQSGAVSPREMGQLPTDVTKPVKPKTTKELKTNEVSPKLPADTDVSDGNTKIDIAPVVPPIETFSDSEDFIGEADNTKGRKVTKDKEPLMKKVAKILRKWKPISEANSKELEKTFDKKDHDLVKILASFESYNPVGKNIGDGKVTIGYGMTNTGAALGDPITKEKAALDFKKRLYKTEIPQFNKHIAPFLTKKLTPIQRIVIISLIYNTGLGFPSVRKSNGDLEHRPGFRYNSIGQETNAFKALKAGDYKTFKYQAFDKRIGFVKSAGVINKGLVNRRKAEEEMWDK